MRSALHIIKNITRMLGYIIRFSPMYFISMTVFCIYVSAVDTLSGTIAVQYIFNSLQRGTDFKTVFMFLLFVTAAMVVRHIMGAYVNYLSPLAFTKIKAGINRMISRHAVKMDLEYYESPKFYNDFVWASAQADTKLGALMNTYAVLIARLSEAVFLGLVLSSIDRTTLYIMLAVILVRVIFENIYSKKYVKMEQKAKPCERRRDYFRRILYLSDYAKEIRLSDMHKTLYKRFCDTMSEIKEIYRKDGRILAVYMTAARTITSGVLDASIYLYLAYNAVITKTIMFGDAAAIISSAGSFSWILTELLMTFPEFIKHSLYIDSFNDFMDTRPRLEGQQGRHILNKNGTIKLKNVSFSYHGESKRSLSNIDLTIRPYEKIAIVGYNGAGKSTLTKLLMRFYDVSGGAIYYDGVNIKEYDTKEYRSNYGAVFQDYRIFAGTVAENVVMDRVRSREGIWESIESSGLGEKISELKDGIDTQLTKEFYEDGTNLSGGEEQKLAISRIFYKDCGIIILDEPSSALDPISEYRLNKTILSLSEHKTVIFISHRLSTTCMADRILMMENGEIIEEGSHAELIAKNGKYAEMFNLQAEKYRKTFQSSY